MTEKIPKRAKRHGKEIGFKVIAVGVVFLGVLAGLQQAATALNVANSGMTAVAMAGFLAGIAAERYII